MHLVLIISFKLLFWVDSFRLAVDIYIDIERWFLHLTWVLSSSLYLSSSAFALSHLFVILSVYLSERLYTNLHSSYTFAASWPFAAAYNPEAQPLCREVITCQRFLSLAITPYGPALAPQSFSYGVHTQEQLWEKQLVCAVAMASSNMGFPTTIYLIRTK